MSRLHAFFIACAVLFAACSETTAPPPNPPVPIDTIPVEYTYRVINEYPHDTGAYTQGLVWLDSVLIEGTGFYNGSSSLRRVELETGTVTQMRTTPKATAFGEGVAVVDNRIVQLTWVDNIAWAFDVVTFDSLAEYHYDTEGWGLTHDGNQFIMSDGTSRLFFRDLDTFAVTDTIHVTDENGPVLLLNELEYIGGLVWANVWLTYTIVIVDPATGRVVARVDCTGILNRPQFNGIAYDTDNDRVFVTGKLWSKLFEIELVKKP